MTEYIETARLASWLEYEVGDDVAVSEQRLEYIPCVQPPRQGQVGRGRFEGLEIWVNLD